MYKRREIQRRAVIPQPKDRHISSLDNNDAEGYETES